MSGFFKSLFGGGQTATPVQTASQPTAAQGVNIQTSVLGKVIPIVFGTTRVSGNLMMYGNFQAVAIESSPTASTTTTQTGGGGKGGMFGGGAVQTQTTSTPQITYIYFAAFAFALCEGQIGGITRVWRSKDVLSLADLDFSLFDGATGQGAWNQFVSWSYQVDSSVADNVGGGSGNSVSSSGGITTVSGNSESLTGSNLTFSRIAYVAAPNYALGNATAMPNHSFEVHGLLSGSANGFDADPAEVVIALLSDDNWGAGFPYPLIGNWTVWQDYCFAAGFFISPAYTSQTAVSSMIDEICVATNSAAFWSNGVLNITPYGDENLSDNGHTYTAPSAPLFSLTDDDFIRSPQGGSGGGNGPITMSRKRPSDKTNSFKIEYLDRDNDYNPAIVFANDQALIDSYGLRTNGSKQLHLFCDGDMAMLSAQLQLRRELICNTYAFDLDQRYILLDPMDIIAISDSTLGLVSQWVRINEISENDDGSLSFLAEDYLGGTGHAPRYTFSKASGFGQNRNSVPGLMNDPVFIEPTFSLAHGLEIWCAPSAPATSDWGGADVYVSTDGVNYQLAGRVNGSSRVGRLAAVLPTYPIAISGLTIDQTDTLSVDLTQSNGILTTTSTQQANNLSSLCWVGGEFIAYATATLTALNKYNITYLVRGAYDSPISSHPIAGVHDSPNFVRLDGGIFKIPYTSDRVGQTISVKFLSFNSYGGGQATLATTPAYNYTILGTAMTAPLDNVTNAAPGYIGNILSIDWSEIDDFRPVLYEIRKGESWDGGQFITRQAHPPFKTFGNGTYWLAAYSQPIPNVVIYSPNPVSVVISAATVIQNITATRNEDPTWTGALSGDIIKTGVTLQTNGINGGTYTISTADRIFITAPFACGVLLDWTSAGVPLSNSVFQYNGTASFTSGSNSVTGLQIFSGNGILNGGTTVSGLATTLGMGPGQPITGVGISSGTEILAVTSTTKVTMTIAATTGSTITGSTQTITVNPDLQDGLLIQSTRIANNQATILTVPTLSSITMSTTALATVSTSVNISIDWFATLDFFGAGAAQFANIYPEIRMSQDSGANWGSWQRYVSGYYLGNGFDARVQMQTVDIQSVGVLETFTFRVDVPDRWDHYNSVAVSSTGKAITFRPDGMTTAAFNGGPQGSTDSFPSLVGSVINGAPGDSVAFSSISLSGASVTCYTSTGGPKAASLNVIAKGY